MTVGIVQQGVRYFSSYTQQPDAPTFSLITVVQDVPPLQL
jgi:hypothetical protein